jgi:hypothetical protein
MFGLSSKKENTEKVAIILFADPNQKDGYARILHGFVYAKELSERKRPVKLLFDGAGVLAIEKVGGKDKELSDAFAELNVGIYSTDGFMAGACKACAEAMGADVEAIRKMGIELVGDYHNHPDIAKLLDEGYTLLTL